MAQKILLILFDRYKKDRELTSKVTPSTPQPSPRTTSTKLRSKKRRADSSEEQEQENLSKLTLVRKMDLEQVYEVPHDAPYHPSTPLTSSTPSIKFYNSSEASYGRDLQIIPMGISTQSNCMTKVEPQPSAYNSNAHAHYWSAPTATTPTTPKPEKLKRRWLESAQYDSLIQSDYKNPMYGTASKSRPSVLVMASSTMVDPSQGYDTITLHKVQDEEEEESQLIHNHYFSSNPTKSHTSSSIRNHYTSTTTTIPFDNQYETKVGDLREFC